MNYLEHIREKRLTAEGLRHLLEVWRFKGEKIVFTNGCFDILHRGHVEYLAKAASLGNKLIIGVNSDESVRRQGKGPARPLQDQEARTLILAALEFTSAVVLFEEDTPENLIRHVRPDILVKGADYSIDKVAGADFVTSYGGRVELIELTQGYSTSLIEKRIVETPH